MTISSVRVLHANRTRRGFLERVVNPILSANRADSYTLEEALKEVGTATDKLNRFGIFKSPISVFLDRPDPTNPASSPTDLDVYISAHERGNYTIKTGTEAGASEADAYVNAELRNLFGGAETLNAHGSLGTRTRSAYSLALDTPVLSNPNLKVQVNGFASSVLKSWASHEEVQKGANAKLLWRSPPATSTPLPTRASGARSPPSPRTPRPPSAPTPATRSSPASPTPGPTTSATTRSCPRAAT